MEKVKRPVKVVKSERNYQTNEQYQDYSEKQFCNIYNKLDEIVEEIENADNLYSNESGMNSGSIKLENGIDFAKKHLKIQCSLQNHSGAFDYFEEKYPIKNVEVGKSQITIEKGEWVTTSIYRKGICTIIIYKNSLNIVYSNYIDFDLSNNTIARGTSAIINIHKIDLI